MLDGEAGALAALPIDHDVPPAAAAGGETAARQALQVFLDEALADYGEVLFLSSTDGMAGEAGELFRDLVPRAPDNPKVMWYGGIAAFEDGDDEQGTRLWTRLLDMNPPDAMRQIIEQEARAMERVIARAPEQWTTLFFPIWEDARA